MTTVTTTLTTTKTNTMTSTELPSMTDQLADIDTPSVNASITVSITAYHETMLGERDGGLTLNFPNTRITLRDLIRGCVYEETRAFNRRLQERVETKVIPGQAEMALNTHRETNLLTDPSTELKKRTFAAIKPLNWEEQTELALLNFQRNRYFVLVGDQQIESLETEIELSVGAEMTFLRLIPLAGG